MAFPKVKFMYGLPEDGGLVKTLRSREGVREAVVSLCDEGKAYVGLVAAI